MPTSNLHLAPRIINLVEQVPHRRVLDVGPGWGKYATLLREYLNDRPAVIDAVEAWAPYIIDHRLEQLYDTVWIANATAPRWTDMTTRVTVIARTELQTYDVVLMVDVIEHMPKADARDLLEQVPGRVVICTPVEFFDNGPGLPPTEEHVSHWTPSDFAELTADGGREVEYIADDQGGWCVRLGPQPSYLGRTSGAR